MFAIVDDASYHFDDSSKESRANPNRVCVLSRDLERGTLERGTHYREWEVGDTAP